MIKIPLSDNFILFFNKLHFLTIFFCFTIPYFHSYLVLVVFPFLSRPLFLFLIFPHFPFVLISFSCFPFFSQFASFPQFGLLFPKSAAPVLPHFLLPWPDRQCSYTGSNMKYWSLDPYQHNEIINLFFFFFNFGSVRPSVISTQMVLTLFFFFFWLLLLFFFKNHHFIVDDFFWMRVLLYTFS